MTPFWKKNIVLYISISSLCLFGCRKLVEVKPPVTSVGGASAYSSDATAAAVLTGIYTKMSGSDFNGGGILSMSLLPGLSADELVLYSGVTSPQYIAYYSNNLSSRIAGYEFWNDCYPIIYAANAAVQGLNGSTVLTPSVKQQLLGEALFVRAFCYFYLVNLYGDVPLITGTDYTVNGTIPRTPKMAVWSKIIEDLTQADSLLSADYLDASVSSVASDRVRPTKWSAAALLARAYLYTGDWAKAETESGRLIDNAGLFSLAPLSQVFLKDNNTETIWALQPIYAGQNTADAKLFILPDSGPSEFLFPVYLSPYLVDAFESGDLRKTNWVGQVAVDTITYYYPYKYKVNDASAGVSEYPIILRLAEQLLIRAEARIQQNKLSGGESDLNSIRTRAGLPNTTAAGKDDLLTAIYHERQVELFSEWGHRWLDLKRTATVDSRMTLVTPSKGGSWSTNKQLYPLPLNDIKTNPRLTQNPGY